MKKYIILIAIISFGFTAKSASKIKDVDSNRVVITDSIPAILAALNVDTFKTKPIDSFLTKIPTGYLSMRIFAHGNPKYAETLAVIYPNKVFIEIYVYDFQHMDPRSETFTWDMDLFRKEKIHHIVIYNGVTCINGCE